MNRALDSTTPLFVPGDRPERYRKAASSGTDAIIIDLEDAVAPDAKSTAREAVSAAGPLLDSIAVFVRINGVGTPWHADDIRALSTLPVSGIMLPKAECAADIVSISAAVPGTPIIALIETAAGLAAARAIACAQSTGRLAFGSIDFCADVGTQHTRDALLLARSEIVLASRLGGLLAPLDGVTTSIEDAYLIKDDATYANMLGFGGKLCIHPRQLVSARAGFLPSPEDVTWAEMVIAADNEGAVRVNGAMVDAPVRARAQKILRRINKETRNMP